MEDTIGEILAVIVFGGLALMGVYYATKQSRGHKARQKAADHRGWEYEALTKAVNVVAGETTDSPDRAVLYRMRGKLSDASPWQIETRFRHTKGQGGTAMDESAVWRTLSGGKPNLYIHITPLASLGVTVIGGDKEAELKNISLQSGRHSLVRELRRFAIDPPVGNMETVHQLHIGPEGWQKKYNLFSNDEDAASRLLQSNLPSALLDWALLYKNPSRCPMVTFCPQGVQITLEWTVEKVDTLDQLVALGQTATDASREIS